MEERDRVTPRTPSYADYRIAVVRIGLVLSWLALATLALWELVGTPRTDKVPLLAVLGFALFVLSVVPWRRTIETRLGDVMLALASAVALLALMILELDRAAAPIAVGFLVVVLFAAAAITSTPLTLAVTGLAISGYTFATVSLPEATLGGSLVLVGSFLAACVMVLVLTAGIRSRLTDASAELLRLEEQQRALAEQERELTHLYDVSRTIGAGRSLVEVLPELVGRMARAIDAAVGFVALYRPDDEKLILLSPLWVRGHVIPHDPIDLPLTQRSIVTAAFVAAEIRCADGTSEDPVLATLEIGKAIAAPLTVGGRRIGVVVLGETLEALSDEQKDRVASMAGPAALVLDHLDRYELATTEGAKMAELAELKSEFVSVVSHELRTPLTSIIGVLSTLQRPELAPQDEVVRELVDTAADQAERLRLLIEDLLVVSRLEAATLPVRVRTLATHNVLEAIVDAVPGARGRTEIRIDPALDRFDADPDHLARILRNLLENALKYGGDGPIELGAAPADGGTRLYVIDRGPGIPWAERERIFERFTQLAPHETRSAGGTGLGLHIVRGLCEAMGGRVWYEPTIGGGATFVVELPDLAHSPAGPMATAWNPPST